jgi:hypothetical protein
MARCTPQRHGPPCLGDPDRAQVRPPAGGTRCCLSLGDSARGLAAQVGMPDRLVARLGGGQTNRGAGEGPRLVQQRSR